MKPTPIGTRVTVEWAHLTGHHGVVVELNTKLLNGHDVAVLMDEDSAAGERASLCFYWHELVLES